MASQATISIRVTSSRGASRIEYATKGKYVSLPTNGLTDVLARQPIQPTSTVQAFWLSVLGIVVADITASELSLILRELGAAAGSGSTGRSGN